MVETGNRKKNFQAFHERLLKEFLNTYSPMRLVLLEFAYMESRMPAEDLAKLLRAWCPLKDAHELPSDWPPKILQHVLSFIRGGAIYLRSQCENPEAFLLFEDHGVCVWKNEPAYMDDILARTLR